MYLGKNSPLLRISLELGLTVEPVRASVLD
jgi:hypothetical protein